MSQMKLTVIVCSVVLNRNDLIGSCKKPSWSKITTKNSKASKSTLEDQLGSWLAEQLCVYQKKYDLITYICIRSCKEIWEDSSLNELDQWNENLVYQRSYTNFSYKMSGGVMVLYLCCTIYHRTLSYFILSCMVPFESTPQNLNLSCMVLFESIP